LSRRNCSTTNTGEACDAVSLQAGFKFTAVAPGKVKVEVPESAPFNASSARATLRWKF